MIRRGISAIVFRKERGRRTFLLLRREQNWKGWECLKGGCRKGENEMRCLRREIREETGAEEFRFKKTGMIHSFMYEKPFWKDNKKYEGARNRIYLVELHPSRIRLDRKEHSGFRWASRKAALNMLTWRDYKKIFEKATKQ